MLVSGSHAASVRNRPRSRQPNCTELTRTMTRRDEAEARFCSQCGGEYPLPSSSTCPDCSAERWEASDDEAPSAPPLHIVRRSWMRRGLTGLLLAGAVAGIAIGSLVGRDETSEPTTSQRTSAEERSCGSGVSQLDGPAAQLRYGASTGLEGVVPVLCARLRELEISHRVRIV